MTICLRHDCILTESDERVEGEGARSCTCSSRHNMWIRAHGAWVEQTPDDEYVSFYKQDRAPFVADCVSYLKNFSFFFFRGLSGTSDTRRFDYPYMRLILYRHIPMYNFHIFLSLAKKLSQM